MKIVLNRSSAKNPWSVDAIQWLYINGMSELQTPISDLFPNLQRSGPYGFKEALSFFKKNRGKPYSGIIFSNDDKFILSRVIQDRANPLLVKCLEQLKESAFGPDAKLEIVEIPEDTFFTIEVDQNGFEFISEEHRTWP